jgi:hypothetical protein
VESYENMHYLYRKGNKGVRINLSCPSLDEKGFVGEDAVKDNEGKSERLHGDGMKKVLRKSW